MKRHIRRLIVAGGIIAFFFLIGIIFFHTVEGWSYVNAFYFTGITLTTIGYGDLVPTHTISKIATVFFAFAGVSIVFYSIGVIAQRYFERQEERLTQFFKSGAKHTDIFKRGFPNRTSKKKKSYWWGNPFEGNIFIKKKKR